MFSNIIVSAVVLVVAGIGFLVFNQSKSSPPVAKSAIERNYGGSPTPTQKVPVEQEKSKTTSNVPSEKSEAQEILAHVKTKPHQSKYLTIWYDSRNGYYFPYNVNGSPNAAKKLDEFAMAGLLTLGDKGFEHGSPGSPITYFDLTTKGKAYLQNKYDLITGEPISVEIGKVREQDLDDGKKKINMDFSVSYKSTPFGDIMDKVMAEKTLNGNADFSPYFSTINLD